jgi:hypothetical protein
MKPKRHHHYRNKIGLSKLTAVLLVCGLVLVGALSFVVCKNKTAALAKEQLKMEHEIKLLSGEISLLERKIDQMLDGAKVQPILEANGTWLQKINPQTRSIIRLKPIPTAKTIAQTEPEKP